MEKLRIVELACPYDLLEDGPNGDLAKDLFWEVLKLKKASYNEEYQYGVLPFGTTDFIGTNLMVCEEVEGKLLPLVAYKSVSLSRSKIHHVPFQGLDTVKDGTEHTDRVQAIIEHCQKNGLALSYDSSWAVRQDVRTYTDREFGNKLRELVVSMNVNHHITRDIPRVLAAGVLRFKTDRSYDFAGYEPLKDAQGSPLPPLNLSFLFGEAARIYYLKKFSDLALAVGKKHKVLWDNRIIIEAPIAVKKAA